MADGPEAIGAHVAPAPGQTGQETPDAAGLPRSLLARIALRQEHFRDGEDCQWVHSGHASSVRIGAGRSYRETPRRPPVTP
jgi:hypothetical protein